MQCSWLRLCTTIAVGVNITNCWKLVCCGVNRDQYDKLIIITELLEQIAVDCFNNTFTIDTGTPAKNIPSLDGIDKQFTVYTCQRLIYSSSPPLNSDISTIFDITVVTDPTTSIGHTASNEVELEGGSYNRADRG